MCSFTLEHAWDYTEASFAVPKLRTYPEIKKCINLVFLSWNCELILNSLPSFLPSKLRSIIMS